MDASLAAYSLNRSLGHLASRFSRVILRRLTTELVANGLAVTAEQYSLLVQLWEQNGLTQGALADRSAKDKTTMARLAAALESRGLIERRPGTSDGRERLVFLTDEGKAVMDRATELAGRILTEAQQDISPEQLELCRNVLRRACANLEGRRCTEKRGTRL